MKKGSAWYSIIYLKCARCHETDLFVEGKLFDMPESCSACGQVHEVEPGMWYGAMWVSYIISAFLILGVALFLAFGLEWSLSGTFSFIVLLQAAITIPLFRISRSTWLNFMVRYDASALNAADQDPTSAA